MQNNNPTYNYFIGKINNETNLIDLYRQAVVYIHNKYPEAKLGSNYFHKFVDKDIPLPEFYFLRKLTFRSCIPPYADEGLAALENKVIEHIKNTIAVKEKPLDNSLSRFS